MYVSSKDTEGIMRQNGTGKKSSLFTGFLKIGTTGRLILLIGVFLVIVVPLFLALSQQQARQIELDQQYAILQKSLASQVAPDTIRKEMATEIRNAEDALDASGAMFLTPDRSPEIMDKLIDLAKSSDIEITKALVGTDTDSIRVGADTLQFPVLNFDISLKGQVSKFQNFLLALNGIFPASELKKVYFNIPEAEDEFATANVVVSVYSRDSANRPAGDTVAVGNKPVITFTDKKDKVTDSFKIAGPSWRINWKITATDKTWAGINMIVYRKGETGRYVDILSHTDSITEGSDLIYADEGEFYIKVTTANVSEWEIKVSE